MPRDILLGTGSQAKQERLAWLLEGLGLKLVTPAQASLAALEIEEEGLSHRDNAISKAVAWSEAYGGMSIASDGGLVVPALGPRWDGMKTRRFFEGNDLGRACELLSRMAHLDGKERQAYWVEAIAMADRGRPLHAIEAQSGVGFMAEEVDKRLIKDGFWAGAVWYFPQIGKRYAELTPEEMERVGDHWTALKEQMGKLLREAVGHEP